MMAAVVVLSGCDSLLEVNLPGRIPAASLDDPAMVAPVSYTHLTLPTN